VALPNLAVPSQIGKNICSSYTHNFIKVLGVCSGVCIKADHAFASPAARLPEGAWVLAAGGNCFGSQSAGTSNTDMAVDARYLPVNAQILFRISP
jgi:hypothetical protein